MAVLTWDGIGEKIYETGVDHGVLYLAGDGGAYSTGIAWNGLTTVTESPTGAEPTDLYADNIKYASILSAETFEGTIEAFTYPPEFGACDGSAEIAPGVTIGQQRRVPFGFSYRTLIGNDSEGQGYGYKLHLIYGCLASPSEKSRETINDTPSAVTFSWSITATPVPAPTTALLATATLEIDSTGTTPEKMKAIEDILYGTEENEARMPLPAEVATIMAAA